MLIGALAQYFFGFTIFVLSSFLVLLVLVQRGRGGGLTGALGGPGGQSAFGTKAGDLFTRITIGVAAAWILLCASAVFMLRSRALPQTGSSDRPTAKGNAAPGVGGTGASESGAGGSSATTGATENNSSMPKLDLSNLNLPKTELPSGPLTSGPLTPPDSAKPADTAKQPESAPPAVEATPPAATATPPAGTPEPTPPAATTTETPPEPK